MRIDVLTLFPGMFKGPLGESLLKHARDRGLLNVYIHNIRDYTKGKHKVADDYPYGGGVGMVLKPEPIARAIQDIKSKVKGQKSKVILMCPSGGVLSQHKVLELSKDKHLIVLCGHYEDIDQRIKETLVNEEISIGDYVLTGGELAATVLIDAVVRHIPGVVGDEKSLKEESFYEDLLDFPHYTRPEDWEGHKVPPVLLSGHHEEIRRWRRKKSLERTFFRRPELLSKAQLNEGDRELLKEIFLG